jgi:hypothetical protein
MVATVPYEKDIIHSHEESFSLLLGPHSGGPNVWTSFLYEVVTNPTSPVPLINSKSPPVVNVMASDILFTIVGVLFTGRLSFVELL